MDWNEILDLVQAFIHDPRVLTVLGLILLDVVLAVAEAIRAGTFDWRRLPEFYRTMVVPYVLGYAAAYGASFLIVGDLAGGFAVQAVVTLLWSAIVGNLGASIAGHLRGLALEIE